jgi:hypothetical protein
LEMPDSNSAASRISTMYRFSSVAAPVSTLQIVGRDSCVRLEPGWRGRIRSIAVHDLLDGSPFFDGERFDLIVLHWALDDAAMVTGLRAASARAVLLGRAYELLSPGGHIAGCFANLLAALRTRSGLRIGSILSAEGFRELAASTGFADLELRLALPDADNPYGLVSFDRRASLPFFRSLLEADRKDQSAIAYGLRRIAAMTNLYHELAGSVFFQARRPC